MNKPSWHFPKNDYGITRGINDSGIETFRGAKFKSLAREICQNSLDARKNDSLPVRVEFNRFEIKVNQIPGCRDLKKRIEQALLFWKWDQKTSEFLQNSMQAMNAKKAVCLRISDFNTTGLTGSRAEYNSPWVNLVRSEGASNKDGSQGGSFGIGKMAVYVLSGIRGVFYSTYDEEGISASEGLIRLPYFKADNLTYEGTGFYCLDKNIPVPEQIELDPSFKARIGTDFGTDIYILDFLNEDGWKDEIIISVLENFLYAVFNNTLEVVVQGQLINSKTLPSIIQKYKGAFNEYADIYYEVLSTADEPGTAEFKENIDGLGEAKLYLRIQSKYPRKVAMIRRTGMKIEDKGGISGSIPFAGVLFIEGSELNQFLRSMENPQHTEWQPDRIDDTKKGKRVKRSLIKFIKNSLSSLKKTDEQDSISPDTGSLLSFVEEEKDKQPAAGKEDQEFTDDVEIKNPVPVQNNTNENYLNDTEYGSNVSEIPSGKNGGMGTARGRNSHDSHGGSKQDERGSGTANPGRGKNTKSIPKGTGKIKIRFISLDRKSGKYRLILLPSTNMENADIEILLDSESGKFPASLSKAMAGSITPLKVEKNIIKNVNLKENESFSVDFWLNDDEPSALEAKIHGNK